MMESPAGCQNSSELPSILIPGQWRTLQVDVLEQFHWFQASFDQGYSTWACGYFSQDIANSFQQLYTEHKEEFANVWKEIAKRFKGMPEILGYELMNEPWTGDFYEVYW